MEELYNKIEDYLAGNLSAEDLVAFEKSLRSDPELAAEVALHQRLHATFSDPQEVALRQSLETIGADFDPLEKKIITRKPFYQNIWFYIGFILTLLLVYLLTRNPNTTPGQPESPAQDSLIQQIPDDGNKLSQIDTNIKNDPAERPADPEEVSPPVSPSEPAVSTPDPFAVNSTLEALLDPETWSFRYDFALNANVVELDQGSNLVINGELVAPDIEGLLFTIVIFDNQADNYPSSPLLTQFLTPREISEDQPIAFGGKKKYAVLLDEIIEDLAPGLYYYQIYMESELEPLHTGSFRKAR